MKLKLFPLNLVALPLKIIPLHIFEERYKKMIKDCIDKNQEFGIIYQNNDRQSKIGCSVSIEKIINTYADGRMDVVVKGNKIFKVQHQYLQKDIVVGDIAYMPESEPLDKNTFNPLLDKYIKLLLAVGFKDNLDRHLAKTKTFELLEMIRQDSSLSEPLFPEAENLLCEIHLIAKKEMIVSLADLLRRRTRLALLFHHDFLKNSKNLKEAVSIIFGKQTENQWSEYF